MGWLKGKKTYLVMIIGVIVNGLYATGKIDAATVDVINKILVFFGLGAIRYGMTTEAKK